MNRRAGSISFGNANTEDLGASIVGVRFALATIVGVGGTVAVESVSVARVELPGSAGAVQPAMATATNVMMATCW